MIGLGRATRPDAANSRDFPVEGFIMRSRRFIWFAILVGSTVGGLIPELWGASAFSYSSVLLGGVGGFVGLWIGSTL
jgi:hypothetical protein